MQFTLILNVLLFILCYRLFGNWEVPVKIGFDPFEVVGGFPTLIDSFFDDFFAKTPENSRTPTFQMEGLPDPISNSRFTRKLSWKCPILESLSQCFSLLTSSDCLATSQLSYSFWDEGNYECYYRSNMETECRTPFQRGNLCENVVVGIQRSGNLTVFELDNVMINTQIVQNYGEKQERQTKMTGNSTEFADICQNYSIHEILLASGDNDLEIFQLFPFGINRTQSERTTESCTPPFPSNTSICNCKNDRSCTVPILYPDSNASFCGSTTISIYHSAGFVYSVIVTTSEDPSTSSKHSVFFFDLPRAPPLSRFDLQRGRFNCPSETTCILEILYPFGFLNSLELPYQIGILIFSALLAIGLSYGRN